jgi:NHL repeat
MNVSRNIVLSVALFGLSFPFATACGSQATVGITGQTCTRSATGDDPCGPGLACGSNGRCAPAGYVLVTPTVTPLDETRVSLTWTPPKGDVAWYEVRASDTPGGALAVRPALGHVAPTATNAVMDGLAPGALGKVVIAASIPSAAPAGAPGAILWTPFGAVNEPSVSSTTPLSGYVGRPYAEGMFVSSRFSMFYAHAYVKEASFVFAGYPSSPTARPIYNFASPIVRYPNGFAYPDVSDVAHIWSDGASKVLVSNNNQNRVLVYDHLPLTPETAAPDRLLGQTTWTGTDPNGAGSTTGPSGFQQASGACFNGTTLFVRDNGNHRILGWNGWPTEMGQPADFVLGQPDFNSTTPNAGGPSKATLNLGMDGGEGLDCRGGRLVAADTNNHRVLVWKVAPTRGGVPADLVLGQTDGAGTAASGAGGVGAGGFLLPLSAVTLDGGGGRTAIVVTDGSANRVVEWDDLPAADGAPFDRVFGQPDRSTTTANTGGLSMGSLNYPSGITADDQNRFWVADFNNGRALRFALDTPAAIGLFGQPDGVSGEIFAGSYTPIHAAWSHATKGQFGLDPASGLFAMTSYFRATFWTAPPPDGNTPPAAIQGQPDATTVTGQPASGTAITGYSSAVAAGGRVYWSDTSRILSKPGTFTADNAVPDVILGDQDFEGHVVAPTTLDVALSPSVLATDGQRLLAVDGARIVGWNTAPVASHAPIDFAIGQPTTLENTPSNGGVTARSLATGRVTMVVDAGRLIVADPGDNRVLVWNTVPTTSGAPADVVLGQPDFASSAAGTSLAEMDAPSSVAVIAGKLVVSDTSNSRLLVFAAVPATNGAAATASWDPRVARFSLPAWFDVNQLAPHDVGAYGGRLYVGQTDRVLVMPDIFAP